ncbi:MORN repeat-containing protein 5-like [Coccinella septempunctata]|uniref:MORN repeat-containing protein 5-like n=1 Tax=Coccinella septempunctata TaxID=41139 RepID=UPI001D073760|nr:MORN repeat-containing protein 5-like [Coccinella septempunctata]
MLNSTTVDLEYSKGWLGKYNISLDPEYRKVCYKEPRKPRKLAPKTELPKREYYRDFKTGSSYLGEWNAIEMNGRGRYTFPHGVVYEGEMKNGEFHGEGKLTYPKGQSITGTFKNGEMIYWEFSFGQDQGCSLKNYCKFPDRRYMSTIKSDFLPPGKERITERQPERIIPEGHYDVEDGFYNPKTGWIYSAPSFSQKKGPVLIRMPLRSVKPIDPKAYLPDGTSFIKDVPFVPVYQDEKFIERHCRKAWDETTGYRPDLYEKWMSGRTKEMERYRKKFDFVGGAQKVDSNCLKMMEFFRIVGENRRKEMEN